MRDIEINLCDYILAIVQRPTIDRTPLRRHQCYKKSELLILHQVYCQDPHPTQETLERLAAQLKSTVDKVRVSVRCDFLSIELQSHDSILAMV